MMASLLSAACMEMGFWVFTISTLMPLDNIGVITMKMMSSTSITSTIGVTLMSATGGGAFALMITDIISLHSGLYGEQPGPSRCAPLQLAGYFFQLPTGQDLLTGSRALRPLQEVVDQLGAGIAHFHIERFDLSSEVVEHPHRGDGHKKSDSRGHQGLGNTSGHGAQTGRLLGRNSLERVDAAHHRSEQAHKGGRRTDCCQSADAALHLRMHDRFRALQGPLGGLNVFARYLRAHLMGLKLLKARHHHFG